MQEKTINNLLLHCEVARALCDDFFSRIVLAWVICLCEWLSFWLPGEACRYFNNCNSLEDGLVFVFFSVFGRKEMTRTLNMGNAEQEY